MPILIKTGTIGKPVSPSSFKNEKELEELLIAHPQLLRSEGGPEIAFVSNQVILRDAGKLDVLLITSEWLPIIVEVKLARNEESRREVVGQAIDYLSSLTDLTVDELDKLVNNKLEKALRQLAGDDDAEFDKAWTTVGENLRAGRAQLIVALDDAPLELERIFRFLARHSYLDVQLLTVQRYANPDGSEIFVPRLLVNPASEDKPGQSAPPSIHKSLEQRLAECENNVAIEYFNQRLTMPRNSNNDAVVYHQGGKKHWYATPTKTGGRVTQIDRFKDDEAIWESELSNPDIKHQQSGSKDNLVFDLITRKDFEFFVKTVENAPPRVWLKPGGKGESGNPERSDPSKGPPEFRSLPPE